MMIRSAVRRWLVVLVSLATTPAFGLAQEPSRSSDTSAADIAAARQAGPWMRARESHVPPLRRPIAVRLNRVSLPQALDAIARAAGVTIGYGEDVLRSTVRVTLQADGMQLIDALTAALDGTRLDAFVSMRGDALLVRSVLPVPKPAGSIVGRVSDSASGAKLSSVDVLVEGRQRAVTNADGWYRVADVAVGTYNLTFRRVGYAKATRTVTVAEGREDTVNVALALRPTRLDELVSTATGQRRRLQVPNDITVLNADSIMQTQPIRSVTDLLDGRVPGLTVQRTSGAPGDPARLRLRGAASPLKNNDPIVVVDGVRIYAEQSADRSANLASRDFAAPSPIDYIDPNTIETIEVVKGASAATLYGQDAANGVIVITTKKGKAGPTRWDIRGEHGLTDMVARFPEHTIRWGHTAEGRPVFCPLDNFVPGFGNPTSCVADSVVRFQLLNEPDLAPVDRGHRSAATASVSGGVQALTYSVTSSYEHEVGLIRLPAIEADLYQAGTGLTPTDWMRRPQSFTRWGVQTSLGARLGKKADLSIQTQLSQTDQQRSTLETQLGALDGVYFDRASGTYYLQQGASTLFDYIATTQAFTSAYRTRVTAGAVALKTGAALQWHPQSWLQTQATVGLNVVQRNDRVFLPRGTGVDSRDDTLGALSDGRGRSIEHTLKLQARATRQLSRKLIMNFTTGIDYVATSINDIQLSTRNLPEGQEVPGSIVDGTPGQNALNQATFGWFMEPALDFGSVSLLPGLRFDGGSSYGGNVTLPAFPRIGGSWLISDEPFFPFKDVFSAFRVRGSYGRATRQPGPADRLRLYNVAKDFLVNDQFVSAIAINTLGNTELRPERTSEIELGFDADLLDGRLSLNATGYRKNTDDALLPTPLPPSLGSIGGVDLDLLGVSPSILRNIGTTRNTGLEASVVAQPVRSGPVTWTATVSLNHRRDEVVRLGPGVEPFYMTTDGDQRIAPGYPLFGFWAKPVQGYADANGDGVIAANEIALGDTAVYRGGALPDYTATFSNTFQLLHGALRVTADITRDQGLTQHLSPGVLRTRTLFAPGRNDPESTPAEQAAAASTYLTSYFSYQNVSVTRLNSIGVSYTVPSAWAKRVGAERLAVSLQGSNLRLWTNYSGVDPNVNGFSVGNLVVDSGQLPRPRTWQMQINVTY